MTGVAAWLFDCTHEPVCDSPGECNARAREDYQTALDDERDRGDR